MQQASLKCPKSGTNTFLILDAAYGFYSIRKKTMIGD